MIYAALIGTFMLGIAFGVTVERATTVAAPLLLTDAMTAPYKQLAEHNLALLNKCVGELIKRNDIIDTLARSWKEEIKNDR